MVNQEEINFKKEEYEKNLKVVNESLKSKEKKLEEIKLEVQSLNQQLANFHNFKIRRIINPKGKGTIDKKIADCLIKINELNGEIGKAIKEKISIKEKFDAKNKVSNSEETKETDLIVMDKKNQQGLGEEYKGKERDMTISNNYWSIHPDLQKEWKERGFSYEERKKWINSGLKVDDANYACWLRDIKKVDAKWLLEHGNNRQLRREYRENWERKNISEITQIEEQFPTSDYILEKANSQEHLDSNYLDNEKRKLKESWIVGNMIISTLEDEEFQDHSMSFLQELEVKITPQQWLEKKYSDKGRTTEIILNSYELKNCKIGELNISDYPNLVVIRKISEDKKKPYYFLGEKEVKNISRIVIDNCPKLKEVDIEEFENNKELILNRVPNLTYLFCSGNNLTNLNLVDCPQLKQLRCQDNNLIALDLSRNPRVLEVHCFSNKLTTLDLTNHSSLKEIQCYHNCLTEIKLPLNGKNLERLNLGNNQLPKQDLSFLSYLINLKELRLRNNSFTGSLNPLKNLTKLEILDISGTDIDSGLEYLPFSLQEIIFDPTMASFFSFPFQLTHVTTTQIFYDNETENNIDSKVRKFDEELFIYGGNLNAWREAHPKLMTNIWGKELSNPYEKNPIKIVASPSDLFNENKTKESHHFKSTDYEKIALRDERPFSWETGQTKPFSSSPIKLYNIKTGKVEWTKDNPNVKNYATLSYVWGNIKDENLLEKMKVIYHQKDSDEHEEKLIITKWGKKSLDKAVKTCKFLGIDYLWIDQLCINQKDREEKADEVRKMRKCYGESEVTLISINAEAEDENTKKEASNKKEFAIETLKKIVNSQWFSRSWTFQEGLLSKQTIFMFDDCLIDGRVMAQVWASFQEKEKLDEIDHYKKLNKEPNTFITPLGWTYCKKVHNYQDQSNLGLSWSLESVKSRDRGILIDGIYSILGLLIYGDKVPVSYKPKLCPECPNGKETKDCNHEAKNKKWVVYNKEDLEKALLDVMKVAVQEGFFLEPLTWLGPRRNESDKWWIPQIDKNGLINVWGGLTILYEPKNMKYVQNGIELIGSQHIVKSLMDAKYMTPKDGVSGRLGIFDTKDNIFGLWGTEKTLEKIRPNDILAIPSNEQWIAEGNEGSSWFALLVPNKNNQDCPIDVVRIEKVGRHTSFLNKLETRIELLEEKLLIDMVRKEVIELDNWEDIHSEFTDKQLVKQWKIRGLSYDHAREWTTVTDFQPHDFEIVALMKSNFGSARECGIFLTKWSLAHPELTPELQREWESKDFDYNQDKSGIFISQMSQQPQVKITKDSNLSSTPELTQSWTNHNFTPQQVQEWINIGLQSTDHEFATYLRDNKHLTPEQVLNHHNLEQLNQEFFNWWQEQQQTQIEQQPK